MTDPSPHELTQIFLSPPDVGPTERELLLDAFDSNWIAPLGPHVDGFEADILAWSDTAHAVALSSGTAALHLALLELGVGPGDEVVVPTFTFGATAFVVTYCGATPVFIDSDEDTWNLDGARLAEFLDERAAAGRLPKAVLCVDLYGDCADYDTIEAACERHDVALIEDAAESLGAWRGSRRAGSFGHAAVFSFNGNKIITTSGGGMLVTDDERLAERVRYLSTQARQPVAHYEHTEVGYNYRLSNLLAALGRGQLMGLAAKIEHRRSVRQRYIRELEQLDGWSIRRPSAGGTDNGWLTVALLDPTLPYTPTELMAALAAQRIESRPAWKPMHQQPVFADALYLGGTVAEQAFERGVCLPSGSSLTETDQARVIEAIVEFDRAAKTTTGSR